MTRAVTTRAVALAAIAGALGALFLLRDASDTAEPGPLVVPGRIDHVRQTLFEALQPVDLPHCDLERFGEPNDGGYLLCGNLLDDVEAAYSYGIGGFDGWGCQISERLGVTVHRYDCFDTSNPACPGGNAIFHAECVAASSRVEDGRTFDTVARQVSRNGDGGRRLVMKMDVEGAEWDVFLEMPDDLFDRIDQLAVEFHGVHEERFLAAVWRLRRFFHVAHLHFNNASCIPDAEPFPAWAYEVLFVNKRFGAASDTPAVRRVHSLDAPNHPQSPDCQAVTPP